MLSGKQRKWLEHIALASKNANGMYSGERCDLVPNKIARALESYGFIAMTFPYNPVHKERYVITDMGEDALKRVSS